MSYWENKTLEEKYKMRKVFEKQLVDLKEIVPDFYIANATCHFDEHSPHLHIVGVPVKENCKTGLSKQVGKTSIFTKDSLVIIQDKMREKCIKEFNNVYELDSKLKEKQKGKNKDYTPYERLKFNEKANELKKENQNLKSLNYQYESRYKDLKEKTDYLVYHLNKVYNALPQFIRTVIDRLFNNSDIQLKFFKQQFDPEIKEKERKSFESRKRFNPFNKNEINKSFKHINNEMEKSAEKFYSKKEKDDGLSL